MKGSAYIVPVERQTKYPAVQKLPPCSYALNFPYAHKTPIILFLN